jgi:hypothetical protein
MLINLSLSFSEPTFGFTAVLAVLFSSRLSAAFVFISLTLTNSGCRFPLPGKNLFAVLLALGSLAGL